MFKQLYRDGLIPENITDGFDPIRVPKAGEQEIKALQDDEVMIMLDAVTNGTGLTEHQRPTGRRRKRDKSRSDSTFSLTVCAFQSCSS